MSTANHDGRQPPAAHDSKRQRTGEGGLAYLALHYSEGGGVEEAIEWASYRDASVAERGVATKVDDDAGRAPFIDALAKVAAAGGYVVAFQFTKPLFMWFRSALSDDEYDNSWRDAKKFHMKCFDLFLLVDEECYEYWSLAQLHSKIRGGETTFSNSEPSSAEMVGESYHWFATHRSEHVAPIQFSGPIEKMLIRSSILSMVSRNEKRKKRARWISNGGKWNVPNKSEGKHPVDMQYVVVDVETHDWAADKEHTRQTSIGRIVEMAWVAYSEGGEEVESKQYLLKPHGYETIAKKAVKYHGITNRLVEERGSDAAAVFEEFASLLSKIPPESGFVIAHNMKHEDAIFYTNLDEAGREMWEGAPKCDTMDQALLALLPREHFNKYTGRKYGLSLLDLYNIVCPNKKRIESAHQALSDVRMAWEIFSYYRKAIRSLDERCFMEWKPK